MENVMGKEKPKKVRQYRSNQGRSPRQQRGSYMAMAVAIVAMLGTVLILAISNYFGWEI
jgi:hypothetical protein